jgi:acetyl-CoA carboxylase biotin carboxyl carrier protein
VNKFEWIQEVANTLKESDKKFRKGESKSMSETFDMQELASILKMLNEFDVSEFELERDGQKLKLKRGKQSIQQPSLTEDQAPTTRTEVALSVVEGKKKESTTFKEVKSPMVGTFYRRPSVDAKPYVEVGDIVKKGTVLCIVEAMKLMNEIESDVAGRIADICLEDGQMAEYGEVLFKIEPITE